MAFLRLPRVPSIPCDASLFLLYKNAVEICIKSETAVMSTAFAANSDCFLARLFEEQRAIAIPPA